MADIRPFSIDVPEETLVDLRDRLARARWSEPLDDPDWEYGIEQGVLRELARSWADEYDWRRHEAELNAFDQFTTEIDGQGVHFVHVRSPHASAMPLIITHGWPGSIVEFRHIIGPLTDPVAHGGNAEDAFHVVCPSLPGYGFSQPNNAKGWSAKTVGTLFAELMARLGYDRYGAQGGDWGAFVSQWIARLDPEHCAAIHLNFLFATPPSAEALAELDEAGRENYGRFTHYIAEESGYANIQGTKPETLGYALNDSPIGLLAWIAEKFRTWTDCDGVIENAVSRDDLLTNITLYWVTATAASAARMYRETRLGGAMDPQPRLETPVGHACFPKEIMGAPRHWIEAQYNVTHWTDMPRGGHFAALEQPDLLPRDIRSFFHPHRS